jgi:hypothetical protein
LSFHFDAREAFEQADRKETMATLAPFVDGAVWVFQEESSLPTPDPPLAYAGGMTGNRPVDTATAITGQRAIC